MTEAYSLDDWRDQVPGVSAASRELEKLKQAFAGRVHRRMAEHNLTQAELAKRLKIEQPTLAELISGKHKPQPRTLKKLAGALRCSAGDLWPPSGN